MFVLRRLRFLTFSFFTAVYFLGGCASETYRFSGASDAAPASDPVPSLRVERVLGNEGLKRLKEGQVNDALHIFSAGLKFQPDDPNLHFLSGFCYHLQALQGNTDARGLAETGYKLCLARDPGNYLAEIQLGRLYLDNRNWKDAAQTFNQALRIDPGAGDAYLGLAAASYYQHNLSTALAAATQAYSLLPSRIDVASTAAIIFSAAGDTENAGKALATYATLESDSQARNRVTQRVAQWSSWRAENNIPAVEHANSATAFRLASADDSVPLTPDMLDSPSPANEGGSPTPVDAGNSYPAQANQPVQTPSSNAPMQERWTRCDTAPLEPQNLAALYPAESTSDTGEDPAMSFLPPLPVPCNDNLLPKMAVFDIVIIRTEDTASSSHGINLLSALTGYFGVTGSITVENGKTSKPSTMLSYGLAATSGTSDPLYYALNIANAAESRNEVLARPSLIALDRQPSNFFSGRNLSLGISASGTGNSDIEDRAIGINLSLTPTFINDDSMLVSVHAGRSFLEEVNQNITGFSGSLQTSRNMVTANVLLEFGQTLIISGLTEHEIQRASNGVPVLMDIPAVQYLFSNKTTQNFTSSVIFLLTPRKPVKNSADITLAMADGKAGGNAYAVSRMADDLTSIQQQATSTYDSALHHSHYNSMYLQFRDGDLNTDQWNEGDRLENLWNDIGKLIYF